MDRPMAALLAERQRQIRVEGWTPDHDDEHDGGELLRAAVIYLWHGTESAAPIDSDGAPLGWPWAPQWWKPKDRRSNLTRAGALCLAEQERIRRARGGAGPVPHVEHKLQIVLRELAALASAEGREQ